ncbi:septum formation family protein [Longispora fulva]|uniref:Septum formation-related domain-containing protein n=1 Tax=Longispora fulva TaxID=619741 RepID=A0A8J7KJW2_9ACTN|nr:septum formation family protein [Longispora fulva]MBG6135936.1 hypothetical protein [Longispora fulva]
MRMLLVAVLGLAGCTRADPGNGEQYFGPNDRANECWNANTSDIPTSTLGRRIVACDRSHEYETYHVGEIDPTADEGTAITAAAQLCAQEADKLLGAPYLTGRVELRWYPDTKTINGKPHRWIACVVAETRSMAKKLVVARTSSLRGVLAQSGPMTIQCVNRVSDGDTLIDFTYLPNCGDPHSGEFVGLARLEDTDGHPPATRDELRASGTRACGATVSGYLGVPEGRVPGELMPLWASPTAEEIQRGFRSVRCFVAVRGDKHLTRMIKGIGTEPLILT